MKRRDLILYRIGDASKDLKQTENILNIIHKFIRNEFKSANHCVDTLISKGITMKNIEIFNNEYFTFENNGIPFKVTFQSKGTGMLQMKRITSYPRS